MPNQSSLRSTSMSLKEPCKLFSKMHRMTFSENVLQRSSVTTLFITNLFSLSSIMTCIMIFSDTDSWVRVVVVKQHFFDVSSEDLSPTKALSGSLVINQESLAVKFLDQESDTCLRWVPLNWLPFFPHARMNGQLHHLPTISLSLPASPPACSLYLLQSSLKWRQRTQTCCWDKMTLHVTSLSQVCSHRKKEDESNFLSESRDTICNVSNL